MRASAQRSDEQHGEGEKRSDASGVAVDARKTGLYRRNVVPLGMLTGLLEMG